MQIEKLEYFLEVARIGSINQAAQNLHISHQALNQSIHLMEKELGVKLFEGSRKGSSLTEQGEIVKCTAETVVQAWKLMQDDLYKKALVCDVVRIGCVPYCEWLYYEVYAHIKNVFPNVQMQLLTLSCEDALSLLANGELEIAFVATHKNDMNQILQENPSFDYLQIDVRSVGILINKESPLSKKERIAWADIQNMTLLFSKRWENEGNWLVNYAKARDCHNIMYLYSENSIVKALEENLACMLVTEMNESVKSTRQKVKFVKMEENMTFVAGVVYSHMVANNQVIMIIKEYVKRYCK